MAAVARTCEAARACEELPQDAWFAGYRFDERKSGGYPALAELDAASRGRPLFILRRDGHLGLANSAAFQALGIDPATPDPPFGAFDRDPPSGAFTGLVRETAVQLFLEHIHGGDTVADLIGGLQQVFDEFLGYDITSAYNSLTSSKAIQAYQRMRAEGLLKLRVGIIASGREAGLIEALIAAGIRSGFGDDWVRTIGIEWCPDCSTSGRTAAYYEPYIGDKALGEADHNTGMLLYERDDFMARAIAPFRAGKRPSRGPWRSASWRTSRSSIATSCRSRPRRSARSGSTRLSSAAIWPTRAADGGACTACPAFRPGQDLRPPRRPVGLGWGGGVKPE